MATKTTYLSSLRQNGNAPLASKWKCCASLGNDETRGLASPCCAEMEMPQQGGGLLRRGAKMEMLRVVVLLT